MDVGAYDNEYEVLINDGVLLKVSSVEELKDEDGNKKYTLITLSR